MASRIRIAVDCMSGDLGPRSAVPAALKAVAERADLEVILVGHESSLLAEVPGFSAHPQISLYHAPDVVQMDEKPSHALKYNKNSSMRVAIDLLHQGQVDAVVSAGNTGALMAIGCVVLKTLPGIDRPAICSAIPSAAGFCHLLDLGANAATSAEQLYQFALLGSALASAVDGCERPRVALLNMGVEAGKGNDQVKMAAALMEADRHINYIGFLEGDKLFSGDADVVVADGFVGNVALKVCEGTANYIAQALREAFSRNLVSRLAGIIALPVLRKLYHRLDPQRYSGASFLGLRGIVVKSHGHSSVESFYHAILHARSEVSENMLARIEAMLANKPDVAPVG